MDFLSKSRFSARVFFVVFGFLLCSGTYGFDFFKPSCTVASLRACADTDNPSSDCCAKLQNPLLQMEYGAYGVQNLLVS